MVYLRLQPYRQSSFKKKGAEKLKPCFYGPYKIIQKVGEVAYKLELPQESKIHNVFHVSSLKKTVGQQINPSFELPPLDDKGLLVLVPEKILHVREGNSGTRLFVNTWYNERNFPLNMPHGKENMYCSIYA